MQDNHQDANRAQRPAPASGTQPAAVPGPDRPALAPRRKMPVARIKQLLLWLVLLGLLLMALAVVRNLLHPPQWIFSAKAKTGVVELLTPDGRETRWRINGAVICIRGELGSSPATVAGARLADSTCGGTAWTGYRFRDPELTLILRGAVHVTLELAGDQRLFVSLRQRRSDAATDDRKKGAILSFTDGTPDIVLGKNGSLKVNLIWPGTNLPAPESYTDRIFPFSAITTIGRDINWTGTSLLLEGDIEVYTYDDSPDKRQLVDTAELMLGDRVRLLDFTRDDMPVYPKGFVRQAPGNPYFDIVAFGAADRVHIERYGENGYDFKPGLISQLTRDPLLIGLLSFLVAAIGLLSTISGMLQQEDEE